MRRATILLLSAGFAAAQPVPPGIPLGNNGLLVGATAEVGSSEKEGISGWKDGAKVKTVIARDFGLVQTTAYPAWDTWTGTGINNVAFDMSNANEVINWAKGANKKTALHLLTGSPTYFPAWLNGGTWTAAQLEGLQQKWIDYAMTSNDNAKKIDYWNVVNEVFMWNGNYWDSSSVENTNPWHRMGWEEDKSGLTGSSRVYPRHPVYIRKAFEMARKHTKAKLELRDYGIEFWIPSAKKTRAFYQLVKHLLATGTPIDAVGFQGHFRTDNNHNWSQLKQAVEEYRKLGLEVYITEIDYGDADPIAPATSARRTPAWDTLQAKNLRAFATAAVSGGVNWLCMWGVADNTNTYWRKGQSALLYDESYAAKYAYDQFRQGIVDGLATTSVQEKGLSPVQAHAQVMGNRLVATGLADGPVQVRDARGAVVARLDLRAGEAALPSLARGVYALQADQEGAIRFTIAR
jgi:GH35 family endo-1,4-beta-xylanase